MEIFLIIFITAIALGAASFAAYSLYTNSQREAKNFERGLKMTAYYIHIPPSSSDVEGNGRDERDVAMEVISQTEYLYNILASTTVKAGFKERIVGQRHLSLEIVASRGLVHYYIVAPHVLSDVVKQAVTAAYPNARLEEVEEENIFSPVGKMSGTIGGELTLKKSFTYPIATYQESKRDAARAILIALSSVSKTDGVGIQIMIRPASAGWSKSSSFEVKKIKKDKGAKSGASAYKGVASALWKPPESSEVKSEDKQLTALEQAKVDAIEEKTKHPGFETLIRVVASSNTAAQSQALLKNVIASFALFDSQTYNGFKFTPTRNVDELVTAYILRFFPQSVSTNILNSVELATLFHLPDQKSIPTSQVTRQMVKQVDGPTDLSSDGFLLGINEFRGIKKEIRLGDNDRRRHVYFIGQTGTGKSGLLERLAYQDMLAGRGFAFIDPHGDSAEKILGFVPKSRVEDVVYFNPGDLDNPMGLNLFEFKNQDQKDFLVQETINILYALYDPNRQGFMGARFEQIFRNCALLLMSDPAGGTFIDVPKLLVDYEFVKQKLKYVTDQNLMEFWTKEWPNVQKSNEAGDLVSWVASKFGAFLSNTMMRNIIGQNNSSFDIREIMDNKKILLVNLSKGLTGELNSKLLGMIFVMKFQAAAMSRADTPENEREDFSLYVDEFQNFATDSFESIMSEARKYRLSLILANQFMTQLTDKIREAILGNVGTIISGRIGVTDAEIMQKKFQPVFEMEDLTKLPNFQTITSVMIHDVPSASFSMTLPPLASQSSPQLRNALKRLSAVKYSRPRAAVEEEIFARLKTIAPPAQPSPVAPSLSSMGPQPMGAGNLTPAVTGSMTTPTPAKSTFLEDWLAKRQAKQQQTPAVGGVAQSPVNKTTGNKVEYNNIPEENNGPKQSPSSEEAGLSTNADSVLKIR